MQLLGDLDVLSFVRISVLSWIGRVKVFNNIHKRSQLGGRPNNRWWDFAQTDINKCKTTNWKERSNNRADWEKFCMEAKVRIRL